MVKFLVQTHRSNSGLFSMDNRSALIDFFSPKIQTNFQVFQIASMATMALAKPKEDVFAMPDAYFQGPNTERRYKDLHAITLHYNPDFDHRKFWYYGSVISSVIFIPKTPFFHQKVHFSTKNTNFHQKLTGIYNNLTNFLFKDAIV